MQRLTSALGKLKLRRRRSADTATPAPLDTPSTWSQSLRDATESAAGHATAFKDMVLHFVQRSADAARHTLRHTLIVFALVLATACISFIYLYFVVQWYFIFAILPACCLIPPAVVLWICQRLLLRIVNLPNQVRNFSDALVASASTYKDEITTIESASKLGLLLRWRSYLVTCKMLWNLRNTADDVGDIASVFGTTALMANPLFWIVLFASLAASLVLSVGILLCCALHYYL